MSMEQNFGCHCSLVSVFKASGRRHKSLVTCLLALGAHDGILAVHGHNIKLWRCSIQTDQSRTNGGPFYE